MSRRPDLIVPIRDRRKRRRYLTLKNAAAAALVVFLAFVAISIRSEMRDLGPLKYGRAERRTPPPVKEAPPVEVVVESQAPSFVEPHVGEAEPPIPILPSVPISAATAAATPIPRGEIAIVGGPEGVRVVRQERPRPVLSGGFGRP